MGTDLAWRVRGTVFQVSVSPGGVPKHAVALARVAPDGIEGDAHADPAHHGGADRAVCLFSAEVIERLRGEGHPIAPGTTGENLTLSGLDWSRVAPGGTFLFDGGVELEVTRFTTPCATIRESFAGLAIDRIRHERHPGESRVYARVVCAGEIRPGEGVTYRPA